MAKYVPRDLRKVEICLFPLLTFLLLETPPDQAENCVYFGFITSIGEHTQEIKKVNTALYLPYYLYNYLT